MTEERSGSEDRSQPTGTVAWVRAHSWGLLRWSFALVVATLVIPAATKQWSDRGQELQVKEALLTDVSEATADAVYGAVGASFQKGERQQAVRDALATKWQHDRAALDPRFEVYFGRSDAADHWFGRDWLAGDQLGFRNVVRGYVYLACCDKGKRERRIRRLQDYLVAVKANVDAWSDARWSALKCAPQEHCRYLDLKAFHHAYRWLGELLLSQQQLMLDQVMAAHAEGFSSGWGDFLSDLVPLR